LAQEYQVRSGQTATVDNRTGGPATSGSMRCARKADGTTLLVIPAGNLTINPR
jgi:hypothetical protein